MNKVLASGKRRLMSDAAEHPVCGTDYKSLVILVVNQTPISCRASTQRSGGDLEVLSHAFIARRTMEKGTCS
ncbi:hypothetical protein, partial [Timonella senegalensis]|uniref:hypothetical protein n=1 Tax=Timonella senegalensis TaxID=1465825 RepID=UPI0028A60D45